MMRAIRDYHDRTGYKIGYKPAGGIATAKDALLYLALVKDELGNEWHAPPPPLWSMSQGAHASRLFAAGARSHRVATRRCAARGCPCEHSAARRFLTLFSAARRCRLNPNLFRFGASSLLLDIERQLHHQAFGVYANVDHLSMG